jgi:hypothetical protein
MCACADQRIIIIKNTAGTATFIPVVPREIFL